MATTCGCRPLTDDQVRAYKRDGFVTRLPLLSTEQVDQLNRAVLRVLCGERDFDCMPVSRPAAFAISSTRLAHCVNAWWVNEVLREVVFSPGIGGVAAGLLGVSTVRLVHDQIIYKPGVSEGTAPGPMANVGWHTDAAHLDFLQLNSSVTAWIALQDCTLENGAMQFVRGSHLWGYDPDYRNFHLKDNDLLRARLERPGRPWETVPCAMKAGEVSFHSGLTVHGSGPNQSNAPRVALSIIMMDGDTTYNARGSYHSLAQLLGPYVRHGDACDDRMFPVLWPPVSS